MFSGVVTGDEAINAEQGSDLIRISDLAPYAKVDALALVETIARQALFAIADAQTVQA